VHAEQTSVAINISPKPNKSITFKSGICFDQPGPGHSQLGRVYVVPDPVPDPKDPPIVFNVDIYVAQPNPDCAGSPVGAPTYADVPVQLSRQSPDLVWDSDKDNCTDWEELANAGSLGGLRDPYNWADFMSVYTGPATAPVKDRSITVGDISAIVAHFGQTDTNATAKVNRNSDPKRLPPVGVYHPAFDRGGPIPNGSVAGSVSRQYPPNGSITVGDISAVVAQFGNNCNAPP